VIKVVIRGRRKLHNEEPHDFYSSSNFIRTIKWISVVGYVAQMGKMRNIQKSFIRKSEVKTPLGRTINKY
jgi:hypothetical protein